MKKNIPFVGPTLAPPRYPSGGALPAPRNFPGKVRENRFKSAQLMRKLVGETAALILPAARFALVVLGWLWTGAMQLTPGHMFGSRGGGKVSRKRRVGRIE